MRLDKLILKNFLTYSDFEYVFSNKPLQVQGLNLTDVGQKTNGTGKSGFLSGIEYCITASNSRGVRDAELITFGKKEATAELFASCDIRKEIIHIAWTIKLKGSNSLVLKKKLYNTDEWLDIPFADVNDGKKAVLDWFAISKEDLFSYFIVNKSRFKSFFQSSNKEKVDLINRFSDASIIEGLENIDTSDLEKELKREQDLLTSNKGAKEQVERTIERELNRDFKEELKKEKEDFLYEIERLEEEIEYVQNKKEKDKESIEVFKNDINKINIETKLEINSEIENISQQITLIETQIEKTNKELKEHKNKIKDFKTTDWDDERSNYISDIKKNQEESLKIKKEKDDLKAKKEKVLSIISEINVNLQGSITCPNCSHEWIPDGDIEELRKRKDLAEQLKPKFEEAIEKTEKNISEIKNTISEIENTVSQINKKEQEENKSKNLLSEEMFKVSSKLQKVEQEYNRLQNTLRLSELKLKKCDSDIEDKENKIKSIKDREKNLDAEIQNYKKEIEQINVKIKDLKKDDNKDYLNTLNKDLLDLDVKIKDFENKIVIISDELYERNQWKANFKEFRMFLANKSLDVIEFHNNRYLEDMGSDLRVNLEGFKVKADGSIKDEITATVIRDYERTFGSFSGGEKARLLFASILANRHLINETHPYGGLDFLSIDEVFEGIDEMGLSHLIEAAKSLNIAVMLITHVSSEELNSDILTIVKEFGISRIME